MSDESGALPCETLKVTSMLGSMQNEGFVPDLVTCNAALAAFERGQSGKAMAVFDLALASSLQPNEITCNALLSSCSNEHSWLPALELYAWMQNVSMETSIISHDMAVLSCCAGNQHRLALQVLYSVETQYSSLLQSWKAR